MMRTAVAIAFCMTLAACAGSSTVPLNFNTVQITANAAPACGRNGAQRIAVQQAAVETINRGFDGFVVLGGQDQSYQVLLGRTPVTTNATGSAIVYGGANSAAVLGQSRSVTTGGVPLVGVRSGQALIVRMFKESDPEYQYAIPARATLGPDWEKIAAQRTFTCF